MARFHGSHRDEPGPTPPSAAPYPGHTAGPVLQHRPSGTPPRLWSEQEGLAMWATLATPPAKTTLVADSDPRRADASVQAGRTRPGRRQAAGPGRAATGARGPPRLASPGRSCSLAGGPARPPGRPAVRDERHRGVLARLADHQDARRPRAPVPRSAVRPAGRVPAVPRRGGTAGRPCRPASARAGSPRGGG